MANRDSNPSSAHPGGIAPSAHPGGSAEHNQPVLSVSELAQALKRAVEQAFGFVRVRGEISGFKRAASGHLYFALKDADAVLDAVCWRGTAGRLAVRPEDGLEVVCTGRLTTYPGRSRYQIVVEAIEVAGVGALLKQIEDRRKRLAAEGLFDDSRKRPLPRLPAVIGVVTSPTGAVIRDILHRLADRFPRRVLIWPVLVQGEGAAEQIAAAIAGFNGLAPDGAVPRPDLLIVARGGGSIEDLMPFNEEIVVRAASASAIPLISAVGHETDTTLIDFASDRRAPTPTAAAEMAVPVRVELMADVASLGARLAQGMARQIAAGGDWLRRSDRLVADAVALVENAAQRLDDRVGRLANSPKAHFAELARAVALASGRLVHPREYLRERAHAVATLAQRLGPPIALRHARGEEMVAALGHRFASAGPRLAAEWGQTLDSLARLLDSFSYARVLERGFVLAVDPAGHPVTSVAATQPGQSLALRFHDGETTVTVDDGPRHPPARRRPVERPAPAAKDKQGTLL
ncbi:MAG: exodeoxyribonuclease VII large subunit [Alphaproteobacteria bacterium]